MSCRSLVAFLLATAFSVCFASISAAQTSQATGNAPAGLGKSPPQAALSSVLAPSSENVLENPWSRFEIVSLGSLPIALFYTDFSYDLTRFFAHNFDSIYAPWPFKNEHAASLPDSAPLGQDSKTARLVTALGLSLIVGGIDAYIHAGKVKAAKRLREAKKTIDSSGEASTGSGSVSD